jgi:O-antigen/teichoic acid export membrane protein
MYGEQYSQYGGILRGYAVITVLTFATMPLQAVLRAYEITRYIFYSSLLAAVFTLVSAHYLVSTYHLTGVVMGVISVQVLIMCSYMIAIKRVAGRSN